MERLARLTDLVLVLLSTDRPITLREIVGSVEGYPKGDVAARQAFERDKRLLKQEGVPIRIEPQTGPDGQPGYRIDPEEYYLPELGLADDERAALEMALAEARIDQASSEDVLHKLGGATLAAAPALCALPAPAAVLGVLHEAVRERRVVGFAYKGEKRSLQPHGLVFKSGNWYLVGWDTARAGRRTFRVDRMLAGTVEVAAGPASFEVPAVESWAGALDRPAWSFGEEEPVEVEVRVDGSQAYQVARLAQGAEIVSTEADGSIVARFQVSNLAAFRSYLLGLAEHAVVLRPLAMREMMVSWLAAMARPLPGQGGQQVVAGDAGAGREA
ncbi:MAG: helix-turn-helix transcriptional regulator [Acidimicrobiales bacterium]